MAGVGRRGRGGRKQKHETRIDNSWEKISFYYFLRRTALYP